MTEHHARTPPNKGGSPIAKCRLCLGPGPLTDEDVTPTWLRKHLISRYMESPHGQMPRRHKFRICGQCNAQLGKVFENSSAALMKRLIDADPLTLEREDQRLIGSWTTKTVLLTCLADSKPEHWGHDLARRKIVEMMASGIPPINTSVRLAEVGESAHDYGIPDNYTGNLLPSKMPEYAFFGLNIVGNLCFEVVTGVVRFERYLHWIDRRTLRFIRVWPVRESSLEWPPRRTIELKQVEQMRQAFLDAQITTVNLPDPPRRVWRID